MRAVLYQHGAGDLKVNWHSEGGPLEERHLGFDLGGAISFVLGLVAGARARGEEATVVVNLRNPLLNRGFQEGFLRGHGDIQPHEEDFGYRAHEPATLDPRGAPFIGMAGEVLESFFVS